jgi:hypothetical protein
MPVTSPNEIAIQPVMIVNAASQDKGEFHY